MSDGFNIDDFRGVLDAANRYERQINRLRERQYAPAFVMEAVEGATRNLESGARSIVIYGEPQSGKTEMMICLTARLLDSGYATIVHLLNDSVDLLSQSLKRFGESGLSPAPRNSSELIQYGDGVFRGQLVVFCKKNARDLSNLSTWLDQNNRSPVVVIDDEADYATPNAKVNQGITTRINELVGRIIGATGIYIGVTATPARLNLNNTFDNDAGMWVHFPPHASYTGQDNFFPLEGELPYRLKLLSPPYSDEDARSALIRFFVTVAHLNNFEQPEENYTMLVHTSGKTLEHEADRQMIESCVRTLLDPQSEGFEAFVRRIYETAQELYPEDDAGILTRYILENSARTILIVLNSERDKRAAGDNPAEPRSPFTIIIGGNIVSRGVTFPNLLAMYFTRTVKQRLQQDTYIQRARMFGSRGRYLSHFELTIPTQLYADWHRCFVFHRLALNSLRSNRGSPVWIGDRRVGVASSSSIDRATVVLDKGEMSFALFDFDESLNQLISDSPTSLATLDSIHRMIGDDALPQFLIDYIKTTMDGISESLAIHTSSSITGYRGDDVNQERIERSRGFIGTNQLERGRFPNAVHHVKILTNASRKARVFYKLIGSVQFIKNLRLPGTVAS